MRRRHAILASLIAPIAAAAGCGYPVFGFGPADAGAGGVASSSSGETSVTSASTGGGGTTTTSGSAGTGGLTPCPIGHLVISEVRTRGLLGANDEFVELYNPTEGVLAPDASWTLEAHALDPNVQSYSTRWTAKGAPIPAHGHFLIVGSGFGDGIAPDDKLAVGLTDAASLRLRQSGATVDVVCYFSASDPSASAGFLDVLEYECAGLPVANPHNDTDETDTDSSIERKPGGSAGNCTDTGDNASDFVAQSPSTPQNTHDPPAP